VNDGNGHGVLARWLEERGPIAAVSGYWTTSAHNFR
jgi:hypothetical protein